MSYSELLHNTAIRPFLLEMRIGLEKESQRVDLAGNLAQSDHPKTLGSRTFHPYIQTDFAETQVELITPVTNSPKEALRKLAMIHDVIYRSMDPEEMLWPLSMPPALPDDEEQIMIAKLKTKEDVLYRRYLAKVYGKRKQMVSGIHVNIELGQKFMETLHQLENSPVSLDAFRTQVYLHLAQQYLHYRYVYTYLFGASPLPEKNYCLSDAPHDYVRSIRNSKAGYQNKEALHVSFESFDQYCQDLKQLVAQGKLIEEKEFYSAVRLRQGKGKEYLEDAIRYIELRNVDLNPFEAIGINEEQLVFIQVFLLYLLTQEAPSDVDAFLQLGEQYNQQVAMEHPEKESALQEEVIRIIDELVALVKELDLPVEQEWLIKWQKMARQPQATLASEYIAKLKNQTQHELATQLGRQYHEKAWAHPYQLAGYRHMELSTQIMMFDAIQKGVAVEVLDEVDQFIKLTYNGQTEYVKKANMTSKDNYVVPLIMENKVVTKKVLAASHFRVPQGAEYQDLASALRDYPKYAQGKVVIKPKSTNYGLGITIFKEAMSQADYQKALEIAFKEDIDVLVEEYFAGTEYRFFVINGQTKAIMLRVPANVKGDGLHSIRELVEQKNQDILRGTHHRYPLEKIQLGDIEALMLKEQGYDFETILPKDVTAWLRENSNISTGGDSIDMTDEIPDDYKQIAAQAVEALGAKISGIDLIIPDYHQSATAPDAYGIIEANFNPAMHMHAYPYQGKGRRLTLEVLQMLFPTLKI
ncbi:bifunctional glutamate--cysteine ligase GshA/glutathione synthetase GshB [Enterococcus cecorum]|nr:bifunctional glutamate--cysteine ligase GshA/glutathione synthetase GshB [Enterococcus cecorum]